MDLRAPWCNCVMPAVDILREGVSAPFAVRCRVQWDGGIPVTREASLRSAAVTGGLVDPHGPKTVKDLGHDHRVGLVARPGEELAQDELDGRPS